VFFKLGSMAAATGVMLVLLEGGLRLVPGIFGAEIRQLIVWDPSQFGVAHETIGYLPRPNSTTMVYGRDFTGVHRVDGLGFRNPWPWPEHPAIAVVGDSLTFGYGVAEEEAWPAIVSKSLPDAPLVNLSLIGAGPQQYLRVYETFGISLRPKLLLVGVFAANDFWDAEMFDRWLKSGVGGNYLMWRDSGRPARVTFSLRRPIELLEGLFDQQVYPLLVRSRLYSLVRVVHRSAVGQGGGPPDVFQFADGHRLQLLPGDALANIDMAQPTHRAFQLALDAFQHLDSLASEHGTRTLMVLLPNKEEVYLPLLEKPTVDPARALREAFDARGIEYLDLTPAFRERAAAGGRLFFEVDGHPNEKGYALIAELVLAHLKQNGRKYGLETDSRDQMNSGEAGKALTESRARPKT
jgi:acetyltransferase AlgX (SGNH hydrolase-like protein)